MVHLIMRQLSVFQGIVVGLLLYGAIGYINQFAAQAQVHHEVDDPPLFDRGHQVLPAMRPLASNVGLVLFVSYFVLRWGVRQPRALQEYIFMLVVLFIGRVIIFPMTQYPPPRPGCSARKPGEPLDPNVFRPWQECLDLMYSGHTFHTVLVCLFVLYLSEHAWEKALVLALGVVELLLVLAARLHYTTDVLVSVLVSTLLFYSWPGTHDLLRHVRAPPLMLR